MENGSSWPGSPTNSDRSNSEAMRSSLSERIWYASSTMAHGQVRSPIQAHLSAVATTTAGSPRSGSLPATETLGWARMRPGVM